MIEVPFKLCIKMDQAGKNMNWSDLNQTSYCFINEIARKHYDEKNISEIFYINCKKGSKESMQIILKKLLIWE